MKQVLKHLLKPAEIIRFTISFFLGITTVKEFWKKSMVVDWCTNSGRMLLVGKNLRLKARLVNKVGTKNYTAENQCIWHNYLRR